MLCPDKKELQRKCSAAWDAYAAEIARIADHRAAPSISELVADRSMAVLRLRGEHLKASLELSQHLTRHRC
jgi:hypothetical protein